MEFVSLSTAKSLYSKHDNNNTPYFSLDGVQMYVRVCSIYDGDTLTVVMYIHGDFYKFKCRLMGIDTCEIKSKNDENKVLAEHARQRLIELITGKKIQNNIDRFLNDNICVIWLQCFHFDKYGRVLVNCFTSPNITKSFNQILVDEHLAYLYDGDTKLTEEQQLVAINSSRWS